MRFPFGVKKNALDEYETYPSDAFESKKLQSFALEANEIIPDKVDARTMAGFVNVPEGARPRPKVSHRLSMLPLMAQWMTGVAVFDL